MEIVYQNKHLFQTNIVVSFSFLLKAYLVVLYQAYLDKLFCGRFALGKIKASGMTNMFPRIFINPNPKVLCIDFTTLHKPMTED